MFLGQTLSSNFVRLLPSLRANWALRNSQRSGHQICLRSMVVVSCCPANKRCISTTNNHITTDEHLSSDLIPPKNEIILVYKHNDEQHSQLLKQELSSLLSECQECPIVIQGQHHKTDEVKYQTIPFDREHKLAKFYYATKDIIEKAINSNLSARLNWERTPVVEKMAIFNRAADLVSGPYRQKLNAATILGQGKTAKQAEIDASAELADFLRFNVYYLNQLLLYKPISTSNELNLMRYRGLEGFVAAISPFNFTAIGANLASGPALMGNTVLWKPSDTAILSNYIVFKIFQEAGLPDGVINFVPANGLVFGQTITGNANLAGINFTGSVATFQWLWNAVGANIKQYNSYPRLSGECGGKNYHFVHKSAHLDTVVAQTIRSAFEYSGQKCSACSRLYVPNSIWPQIKQQLADIAGTRLNIGPATDLSVYTSAVIDASAFKRHQDYIQYGKSFQTLVCGGETDDRIGYFVRPTIFETNNPMDKLMREEIFGPILTCYAYPDNQLDETLDLVANDSKYALTGAIFAQDETFIEHASDKLKMSAGNFYINDKSTGAVVGQQPFGGGRLSGTNDKPGGPHYLLRWANPQTIKRARSHLVEWQ